MQAKQSEIELVCQIYRGSFYGSFYFGELNHRIEFGAS